MHIQRGQQTSDGIVLFGLFARLSYQKLAPICEVNEPSTFQQNIRLLLSAAQYGPAAAWRTRVLLSDLKLAASQPPALLPRYATHPQHLKQYGKPTEVDPKNIGLLSEIWVGAASLTGQLVHGDMAPITCTFGHRCTRISLCNETNFASSRRKQSAFLKS